MSEILLSIMFMKRKDLQPGSRYVDENKRVARKLNRRPANRHDS